MFNVTRTHIIIIDVMPQWLDFIQESCLHLFRGREIVQLLPCHEFMGIYGADAHFSAHQRSVERSEKE